MPKIKNMKKNLFIFALLLLFLGNIQAQITQAFGDLLITDSLKLSPLHPWIEVPDSENNLWQIGTPQKPYFNSAYQNNTPILTDTSNFYPISRNDYFEITIPLFDSIWGEVNLSFYHKYDTDTLKDGGIIEISYDNGISWTNIKNDTLHLRFNFINIPQDTLTSAVYGFSGRSNGWEYCELYWQWLMLVKDREPMQNPIIRFRFISDEINTNKEGWMIDHIVFRGYEAYGNLKEFNKNRIQVYPNPTQDFIKISSLDLILDGYQFSLFDLSGKEVLISNISDNQVINIKHLPSGIYFYKLQKGDNIQSGKVIKN